MFILLFALFIFLCVLSIYTVYTTLEIKKDIDTLYDNYAKELEKITKININGRSCIKC